MFGDLLKLVSGANGRRREWKQLASDATNTGRTEQPANGGGAILRA